MSWLLLDFGAADLDLVLALDPPPARVRRGDGIVTAGWILPDGIAVVGHPDHPPVELDDAMRRLMHRYWAAHLGGRVSAGSTGETIVDNDLVWNGKPPSRGDALQRLKQ
jgi:hypothetical protein